ncbi:MAG: prolyl oligopeptidase family serine peptidase [Candidatus Aramenus sp.]|nr:prolyl oligopeptidase family serine peptidase [Candidatus Aramenus sp.]
MISLVLHGKGSSPDKVTWLSDPLKEFGQVLAPPFDYEVREGVERALSLSFDLIAGHSRGGTIALVVGALKGKPVIAVSAPTDRVKQLEYLSKFPEGTLQYRNYLDLSKVPSEELVKYSPIKYAEKLKKVLLIHGKNDEVVLPSHSVELCERVKENGGYCELHLLEMRHSPPAHAFREIKEIVVKWVRTQFY